MNKQVSTSAPGALVRSRVRVKICCIVTVAEARMAIAHGASAVGLVSEMPSGPGVISETEIAEIAAVIPPGVASFLLTSKQEVDSIIAQQRRCGVNTIQLCDRLEHGTHEELRQALPGIALVQVLHVSGEAIIVDALTIAPFVDAILLDSGKPEAPVKELGGTGRTHNWDISRRIREAVSVPVFLAGGLTPGNVAAAVSQVMPYGIDVCSGVRTDGALDEEKLTQFFEQIHAVV